MAPSASWLKPIEREGTVTQDAACRAEEMIAPLSPQAKRTSVICAAHAHIDMNWMWRWDETVAVTLDTFRTMLDLMEEYPDFKFSQSQASVYQIVETYAPEMLEEIRQRVQEGRWEVTASTWVEADKNMPSGESLARHLLYTRRYLSELSGLGAGDFPARFRAGHLRPPRQRARDPGRRWGEILLPLPGRRRPATSTAGWRHPGARSSSTASRIWYLGYVEPAMALSCPRLLPADTAWIPS